MKHFPATRWHPPLAGISQTRAPRALPLSTAALFGAVLYAAGFFTGAILFGELLLTLHR
ncbi:MAG: hypothetical protein HZC55_04235 [Verrucomicrobia bacterium]|nr:hypothetical protein [Verrucomicrobiota bacterium]